MISSSAELKEQSKALKSNPCQTNGAPLQRPSSIQAPKTADDGDHVLANDSSIKKSPAALRSKKITLIRVRHPLGQESLMPVAWMWPMTNISGKAMNGSTALRVVEAFLGEGGVKRVLVTRGNSNKKDHDANDRSSSGEDETDGYNGNGGNLGDSFPSDFTYTSSADSDDTPPDGCLDIPLCNVLSIEPDRQDVNASLNVLVNYNNDPNVDWSSIHTGCRHSLCSLPQDSTQMISAVPDWIEFSNKHARIHGEAMFRMAESATPFVAHSHHYSNLSASLNSSSSSVDDFVHDFSTATDLRSLESQWKDSVLQHDCMYNTPNSLQTEMKYYNHNGRDDASYEPNSLESLIGELTLTVGEYEHRGTVQKRFHHPMPLSPSHGTAKGQYLIQSCPPSDLASFPQPMGASSHNASHNVDSFTNLFYDSVAPTCYTFQNIMSPVSLESTQGQYQCSAYQDAHSSPLLPESPLTPASFQSFECFRQRSLQGSVSTQHVLDKPHQCYTNNAESVHGEEYCLPHEIHDTPKSSQTKSSSQRKSCSDWANDPEVSNVLHALSCGKASREDIKSLSDQSHLFSTSLGEPRNTRGRQIFGRIENSRFGDRLSFAKDTESKGPRVFTIQVLSNTFPSECRVYETSSLVRPTENDRPAIICHGLSITEWVQRCVSRSSTINVWFSTLGFFMDGYVKSEVLDFFQSYPGTSVKSSFGAERHFRRSV